MKQHISGCVAGFLLLAAGASVAVGENVGRITGVVREASSNSPIAGATVTVTGPVLIGPPRTTQTADNGGNPSIKGGNSRTNRIMIDGLDTSDPVTNTFSANINQDSLAEIQVLTGGFEAKYNALGGIQNLVTNSGSDDLHFDVGFYTRT